MAEQDGHRQDAQIPFSESAPVRVPVPDPTLLTTVQLNREIATLKEIIFTRLEGMDKALVLFHETISGIPDDTHRQINHLKDVHEGRFAGIAAQFSERDKRFDLASRSNEIAVGAAFSAQKEAFAEQSKSFAVATAKSELATGKQIEQLNVLILSSVKALEDKISAVRDLQQSDSRGTEGNMSALRDRLTLIEGKSFGAVATQLGHQTSASFVVALVVAAVVVLGFILDKVK